MGQVPIILRAAKDFINLSLVANFQEGTCDFASFIHIFVNFWTPLYIGGTPKFGPIRFIFKLDLLVVQRSIGAMFGSDCSIPSI